MKYILDTHAAIWSVQKDPQLPVYIRDMIRNAKKGDFVIAETSLVEIARLFYSGKVSYTGNPINWLYYLCAGFKPLPVTPNDCVAGGLV